MAKSIFHDLFPAEQAAELDMRDLPCAIPRLSKVAGEFDTLSLRPFATDGELDLAGNACCSH